MQIKFLIIFLFLSRLIFAQSNQVDSTSIEDDVYLAYKNAMRGVIWSINNIPFKRDATYKDIIDNDIKICSIKVFKQEGGIKIVSIGFYKSSSVEIITYKSLPEKFR
ncbi:MAG: hypothetical protein ACK4G1_01330 [Ignavibacteria bacterium]